MQSKKTFVMGQNSLNDYQKELVNMLYTSDNLFDEFVRIKPHLVLMDINLPSYNGYYWCERIRKTSKVPVIFISSRSTNMDIIMAVNLGGDDFITKPFKEKEFIEKIVKVMKGN